MIGLCNIMSGVSDIFTNLLLNYPYWLYFVSLTIGALIVANIYFAKQLCDFFVCKNKRLVRKNSLRYDFDYGIQKGPAKWKELYPEARGCFQSPINIRTNVTATLVISEPLVWNNYDALPESVSITNTGHTVELTFNYDCNQPILSGADLLEKYCLASISFRWSQTNNEGSEHSINDRKYPLELQAMHISKDTAHLNGNHEIDLGILILSYFFTVTRYDNPYLDPIIFNLQTIRKPFKSIKIPSFPIAWLCVPYKSGFYSYGGSLTEPPCTEGVTWFVQPESMAISEKQLAEFRMLLSSDGRNKIMKNSRPVQNVNQRIVCYNRFEQQNTEEFSET